MNKKEDLEKHWNRKAQQVLEGRKIAKVFYMNEAEADEWGWYKRPIVMILDDDTQLIVSADDEGNDGGSIFYANKEELDGVLPTL